MPGPIALIGGEEFSDGFEDVHASLLEVARQGAGQSRQVRVVYLPFNIAADGDEALDCWSGEAQIRLEKLGARVTVPRIVDRQTADDPAHARVIRDADWIYIGGGKPQIGMRIFAGSQSHRAMMAAYQRGAMLAGASAGAMILCSQSWVITDDLDQSIEREVMRGKAPADFDLPQLEPLQCLGVLPGVIVWPHLNQFFSMKWLKKGMKPAGYSVIGIDEQTALLGGVDREWQVLGHGRAVLIGDDYQVQSFQEGAKLRIPLLMV